MRGATIQIGPNEFAELPVKAADLTGEIASRERSISFISSMFYLPNPDPVLKSQGKDISAYRDLTSDGHLWAVMQSRVAAMQCREWRIAPADETPQAAEAADMVELALNRLTLVDKFEEMLDAVFYGYSILETLWEPVDRWILPAWVKGKPQEWFAFSQEEKLLFKTKTNLLGEELPEKYRFLIVRSHASYRNPYGDPVLSRCFWPVKFKMGGWRFWIKFIEKYGMPWPIGKLPPGANKTDRSDMLTMLVNMVQDGVAAIPSDGSIELLSDSNKGASSGIYAGLLDACNAEISKAVLGQTLTTEVSDTGGAYAASQTHQEVRQDLAELDRKLVIGGMNTLIGWICDLNLGADAPRPVFDFVEAEDINRDLADRDQVLQNQGVRFTKNYYARKYNLEETDFEVTEPKQSSPFGAAFAEPDRGDVDGLAESAKLQAGPALGEMLVAAMKQAKAAKDYGRLSAALPGMFDELDAGPLTEALARASFMAQALGRVNTPAPKRATFAEYEPLAPEKAIEYLRQKGFAISWNWQDVWQVEHSRAFTVAHLTKMDILQDIRGAVDRAIAEGTEFDQFQDDLTDLLKKKGWWGPLVENNPKTGVPEIYQAGSSRRLRTIFDTNISVAYAAGQYEGRMEQLDVAPNWMYTAGMTESTCAICGALDGKVFAATDPIWNKITPPNHWNCACDIIAISESQTKEVDSGKDFQNVVKIIPEEWSYNPATRPFTPDLSKYDADLSAKFKDAMSGGSE